MYLKFSDYIMALVCVFAIVMRFVSIGPDWEILVAAFFVSFLCLAFVWGRKPAYSHYSVRYVHDNPVDEVSTYFGMSSVCFHHCTVLWLSRSVHFSFAFFLMLQSYLLFTIEVVHKFWMCNPQVLAQKLVTVLQKNCIFLRGCLSDEGSICVFKFT